MSRKKKKGMNPVVAVAIFLVCGGIAAKSMLGSAGPAAPATANGPVENVDPAFDVSTPAATDKPAIAWRDLLAAHGSFDGRDVRLAFAVAIDTPVPGAAPGGETAATAAPEAWVGDDPPRLRVGVVMVGTGAQRAVFGGRVVGVGDDFSGGRVAAIEPGVVTFEWNGRKLHYELAGDLPREFRAEEARRAADQKVKDDAAKGAAAGGEPAAGGADAGKDGKDAEAATTPNQPAGKQEKGR